jgi:hypothetical protein
MVDVCSSKPYCTHDSFADCILPFHKDCCDESCKKLEGRVKHLFAGITEFDSLPFDLLYTKGRDK